MMGTVENPRPQPTIFLMPQDQTESFHDVADLLESSAPCASGSWFWYLAGLFLLVVLLNSYVGSRSEMGGRVMEGLSSLLMLGVMAAMGYFTWSSARTAQREQSQLESVEELLQLRRWSDAAVMLQGMLSRPARTPQARVQALIYFASALARYERFADAVQVYEHLLGIEQLDEGTRHGLRLGRAMSMLREDRLFDADRAISELRRDDAARESAGLALVEIYRDVKTGHPQEAIAEFEARRNILRRQLSHRFADAIALTARAHDLLGRQEEARRLYEEATLLVPEAEIKRRYPEVAVLAGRYPAAAWPTEAP